MSSSGILRSVRLVPAVAVAALLGGFGLATPAAAHVAGQPAAVSVYTMSAGRLGAIVAAVLGLTGVVVGGLALVRPTSRVGTGSGRLGASIALAAGLVGVALGGLVVATSDSGIGTGNGRAGAYVALVVGLFAMVVGALALVRSRRYRMGS
ncbi:DUF6223 family protein [Micromonospora avicenniae]|uniref:Uncharacterized protein n=1 Tax=Micromonospora avicenniae TaxID=1198245 RepID=A0A1N6VV48_9ACTN|nr:DUF6223 family protein [Micromonospora avicenniae]SIQ81702.1 hypothetical protein SAMN05444858_104261 [Micromonospora avicenniae]